MQRKFVNNVQQDYYDKFVEIWEGHVDDWHDMNNFIQALLPFIKDVFHNFSIFTQSCLNDHDTFDGGK